ncbi:hypothetical protein [Synoicihabitans lomoniglobus]|uniref:DUF4380 domain-containing protein n=1 Tax=Synoicihabitans lomoniglobus TaxID=2909285 RepID=A0AAE9ZWQ3_9BACT|nr:hypothetical protein [Opitutaceae bacterium LMO-M01]WED64484.1 hypothetical protein PXH66_19260 [Opitutaceae bacterium LMO-M01]
MKPAISIFLTVISVAIAPLSATSWSTTTWQGEAAHVATSESGKWSAIVSLERGRLVHFGVSTEEKDNLLFAPATRDTALGWGGHRLWLGPQTEWPTFWPPPAAWEQSAAAATVSDDGTTLTLRPPPTGLGWPDLNRQYQWFGDELHATASVSGESDRAVQIVHILQQPHGFRVTFVPAPTADAPHGYVLLPFYLRPEFVKTFDRPEFVLHDANLVRVLPTETTEKIGLQSTTLEGHLNAFTLRLRPGQMSGQIVGEPEQGYNTQVFLGGHEPFIELEQLTPRLAAGADNRAFTVIISGRQRLKR